MTNWNIHTKKESLQQTITNLKTSETEITITNANEERRLSLNLFTKIGSMQEKH